MKDPAYTWNAVVVGEDTPCWSGTRRHERLKACAAHAAARCCRHDSFANPGRRRLTVAYDAAGTPALPSTRRLSSLLVGSMMRASARRRPLAHPTDRDLVRTSPHHRPETRSSTTTDRTKIHNLEPSQVGELADGRLRAEHGIGGEPPLLEHLAQLIARPTDRPHNQTR
jgi:hypothetical protein